jgi:hypothetical protein
MQAFFLPEALSEWNTWFGPSIALLVVGTLALVGHALLFLLARRMTKRISPALDDTMVAHVRRPTRVVFVCMVVLITLSRLSTRSTTSH